MSRTLIFKDNPEEKQLFTNRILCAFGLVLALTAGLVVRLVFLQVFGHQDYVLQAKENSIKIEPTVAARGIIYDNRGNVLAKNTHSYTLELTPDQIENLDDTLAKLQKLLAIPDEKIEQFQKLRKRQKRYTSIPLLNNMTEEELAKFAVMRPFFRGAEIHVRQIRYYPYGELTAHVLGYVGRISEDEIKELPVADYRGSTYIGKLGVEKLYESELHGEAGYSEIETNVQGRPLKTLREVSPVSGANLHLTLDLDLQKTAYDALEDYNGAVVAIDVKTGGVLAFVSRPGYDPNPFVVGISNAAYQTLQDSPDQPLYNRALRGLYPPGSTIKPFMALAGLENQAVGIKQLLHCPGYFQVPNDKHYFRDWLKSGHGNMSVTEAITQSCDVYFYRLATLLGIDRIQHFLRLFGFGERTGIDMADEKAGVLPSREWKLAKKNQVWFPGETVITGIGQGYHQATPLQLARATAILASKGKVIRPYLVEKMTLDGKPKSREIMPETAIPLQPDNIKAINTAMVNVVHSNRGTARGVSAIVNYRMAGKTGTAQVINIKQNARYDEKLVDKRLRDHALFIAYAPADDPKIAVSVIAENGGHGGSVAAPIAAKVISRYLNGGPNPSPPQQP